MALKITVTTPRCIYQCADYQVTDFAARKPIAVRSQKIIFVHRFQWSATVCFAGVARYGNIDVGEWLAERMQGVGPKDPLDHVIEQLLKADQWLQSVPHPGNRHSFSLGPFIGSEPVFALVSNFERPSGLSDSEAPSKLSVYQTRPTKPKTFIADQKRAVCRTMRRRLEALARSEPDPQKMYSALAEVNREVAVPCSSVSKTCFTTYYT